MNLPSLEKSTAVAEIPDRNGRSSRDFWSKRTNSPRAWTVWTKICFPSALGNGARVVVGTVVKGTGSCITRLTRLPPSRMAQMLDMPPRNDSKTKYLPSGVQLPQYSAGGLLQPGRIWRGWPPPVETSQIVRPLLSLKSKRSRVPSGDQRGHWAGPVK